MPVPGPRPLCGRGRAEWLEGETWRSRVRPLESLPFSSTPPSVCTISMYLGREARSRSCFVASGQSVRAQEGGKRMKEAPYKVYVVVDRAFGDRLHELRTSIPVWIVDTPLNRAAALRRSKEHS